MALTKRTRFEVLKRDNHTCRYCGGTAPDVVLTVDHVTPVALGGSDDPSNLVAACRDCNYGKASTSPDAATVEDVKQTDIKWAGAMERAAEMLRAETQRREGYYMAFLDAWPPHRRDRIPSEAEWSVGRLYDAGLPASELVSVAAYAATQSGVYDRFNYFMGICWKKVTAMQAMAKELLATEGEG